MSFSASHDQLTPPLDFGEKSDGASVAGLASSKPKSKFSTLDRFEAESGSKWAGCREWAERNPAFMERFERLACEYAVKGRHFSMRLVFERCRYECGADNGRELFKCPNDYLPMLSRWVCERHPEVARLTSRRRSRADD